MSVEDMRLATALAALEHNRAVIRARFTPSTDTSQAPPDSAFPRSATFRWLFAAISNRQLMATLLQALLGKHPVVRTLAAWVMSSGSR